MTGRLAGRAEPGGQVPGLGAGPPGLAGQYANCGTAQGSLRDFCYRLIRAYPCRWA